MLSSVFTAIGALLPAGLSFGYSGADIFAESSPPRIVWTPTTEEFGVEMGSDGVAIVLSNGKLTYAPLPLSAQRQLYTRHANVEIRIWERSQDQCETLLNQTVSAIHDCCAGFYQLGGGEWIGVQDINKAGSAYLLRCSFLVPAIHNPDASRPFISLPLTPQVTPYAGG